MKKVLLIIILTSLIASHAISETVLYCTEELSTGIVNDRDNKTSRVSEFTTERYTIKFNNDYSRLKILPNHPIPDNFDREDFIKIFLCRYPFGNEDYLFCDEGYGQSFKYSMKTGRFIYTTVSPAGYIDNKATHEAISAGQCDKF